MVLSTLLFLGNPSIWALLFPGAIMSPDGFGLLFDQVVSQNVNSTNPEPTQGDFIASLWLLPPPKIRPGQPLKISPPEKLFPGLNPVWLP